MADSNQQKALRALANARAEFERVVSPEVDLPRNQHSTLATTSTLIGAARASLDAIGEGEWTPQDVFLHQVCDALQGLEEQLEVCHQARREEHLERCREVDRLERERDHLLSAVGASMDDTKYLGLQEQLETLRADRDFWKEAAQENMPVATGSNPATRRGLGILAPIECDGSPHCQAVEHMHGCFAERSPASSPKEGA